MKRVRQEVGNINANQQSIASAAEEPSTIPLLVAVRRCEPPTRGTQSAAVCARVL